MEGVTRRRNRQSWVPLIIVTVIFLVIVLDMDVMRIILQGLFPNEKEVIYPRANLLILLKEHMLLVFVSSLVATVIGVGVGILVTRPAGRDYLNLVSDISSLAQTIPPVAVLALAVPFIGFGFKPTVLALFLYSILPIIRNSIAGLESVSPNLIEAARGMGMTRAQVLFKIELPLALRVIMAGVRTSVVINVGTATVGAVVGAGGLGTPIISGLVRENPAFVLEGAIAAALLAFIIDQYLARVEQSLMVAYGSRKD